MFGWRRAPDQAPEKGYRFRFAMSFYRYADKHRGGPLQFSLSLGGHTWRWLYYGNRNRLTGSEDNAVVVGWFFRGREGRRKTAAFHSGFAEAAKKPPVRHHAPTPGCPGCDDPFC